MAKKRKRAGERKRGGAEPVRNAGVGKRSLAKTALSAGAKKSGVKTRGGGPVRKAQQRDVRTGAFVSTKHKKGKGNKKAGAKGNAPKRIDKPRLKMKMSEALRGAGVDESRLANKWRRILGRIDMKAGAATPASEKLLVDVLKECSKLLDAYPAPKVASPGDGGAVQFVSNVARPVRGDGGGGEDDGTVEAASVNADAAVADCEFEKGRG